MKKTKLSKAILLLAICLNACSVFAQPSTTPQWTQTYDNTIDPTKLDYGRAITTDASGNVYITGEANYGADYYVATIKYNKTGMVQWTRTVNIGGLSISCPSEGGYAIAVDGSGNVFVAAGTTNTSGTNNGILTLLRYNSSGTMQTNYPKQFGTTNCGTNGAAGLCIAISGSDVYIGGSYYDVVGGVNTWKFIVLNDTTGANWGWNNTPYTYTGSNSTAEHRATDIKVNTNGVYATGWVSNTNSSVISKDVFTVGLKISNGALLAGSSWPQTYNNSYSSDDAGNALALDAGGNVYVAGYATVSGHGKDGFLTKYNKDGAVQSGFPALYNYVNAADAWSDITTVSGTGSAPAVYVGGYRTDGTNTNFALAAYTNAGVLCSGSYWNAANPQYYEGAYSSGAEAGGTDYGYAVEYSATTNRIYITGMSDEGASVHDINLTTVGYDGTSGAKVWGAATYDMGTDGFAYGTDEAFWKYALSVQYNGCYGVDFIDVVGATWVSTDYDFVTVQYGATGVCSNGPAPRVMNNSSTFAEAASLHPNPFSSTAELRLDPDTKITNGILLIYDVTGRVVSNISNISSTTIIIDRNNLPKGLYFFKLTENERMLSNGKFIITD